MITPTQLVSRTAQVSAAMWSAVFFGFVTTPLLPNVPDVVQTLN
jgi:hypothetical protein